MSPVLSAFLFYSAWHLYLSLPYSNLYNGLYNTRATRPQTICVAGVATRHAATAGASTISTGEGVFREFIFRSMAIL